MVLENTDLCEVYPGNGYSGRVLCHAGAFGESLLMLIAVAVII